MWIYHISSGKLYKDENYMCTGYSGIGEGLNNAAMQHIANVGPLPVGYYTIGPAYDSNHGPCTMRLTPKPGNNMYGRSGFLIHADLKAKPGKFLASHGCIVIIKEYRLKIAASADKDLEVVV